jgi:uncharacterized protein (TIGR02246 family)
MDNRALEAEIRSLEDRRYKAMLDGDLATLSELFSDDLVYSHSRGERDSKADYLRKVKEGVFRYLEIAHPIEKMAFFGDSALVWGRMQVRVIVAGEDRAFTNSTLAVWARQDGRWRFVALQPTLLPG